MTNGFQTNSNFETNLSAPTVISLDNQNAGWLIFIHKAPLKSVVNLAGGHPHPSTSPRLLCRPMDVQFSAGSLVWRIRWRTEAKWSDRSTYLGCPRLSRSRILLEADICAAIEQEGAARVGDGKQRKSQPCWCQSQRNHSEVWRAAGAAERVRRAERRCFLIRREEKQDFFLQSCGWDKNSPYSPVAEPLITHQAPESHGASIPKTLRSVTHCEATLWQWRFVFFRKTSGSHVGNHQQERSERVESSSEV